MTVRIRLMRMGVKRKPVYRLVVVDSRNPRSGKYIDSIGYYNPRTDPPITEVDEEKALYWLERGAQPSDTTKAILIQKGCYQKFQEPKKKK